MEFKLFEASNRLEDHYGYFLLWLALLLDDGLKGRAFEVSRVYDLGAVARLGLDYEFVRQRAAEVLQRAPSILEAWGIDARFLEVFRLRLESGRLPADEIIEETQRGIDIEAILRSRSKLVPLPEPVSAFETA